MRHDSTPALNGSPQTQNLSLCFPRGRTLVKLAKAKSQALRRRILTGHHPQLTFGSRGQVATMPIMPIHWSVVIVQNYYRWSLIDWLIDCKAVRQSSYIYFYKYMLAEFRRQMPDIVPWSTIKNEHKCIMSINILKNYYSLGKASLYLWMLP